MQNSVFSRTLWVCVFVLVHGCMLSTDVFDRKRAGVWVHRCFDYVLYVYTCLGGGVGGVSVCVSVCVC